MKKKIEKKRRRVFLIVHRATTMLPVIRLQQFLMACRRPSEAC